LAYRIEYKSSVAHDPKHLDKGIARRIIGDLEEELSRDPDCGEALSGQFKGMFKLRIGDYRVVYSRTKDGVIIVRIGHRSKIYR
jgi:mRNA interferase RelE/StbE